MKLLLLSGIVGAMFGVVATVFLLKFLGGGVFYDLLMVPRGLSFLFPILGCLSAVITTSYYSPSSFGCGPGILAAASALVLFGLLHGCFVIFYRMISSGLSNALSKGLNIVLLDVLFGLIIFGLPAMLIGGISGIIYKELIYDAT